jgi:hypothetical protein
MKRVRNKNNRKLLIKEKLFKISLKIKSKLEIKSNKNYKEN